MKASLLSLAFFLFGGVVSNAASLPDSQWLSVSSCNSASLTELCTQVVHDMSVPDWANINWYIPASMAESKSHDIVFGCHGTKVEIDGIRVEASITGECDSAASKARILFGDVYTN